MKIINFTATEILPSLLDKSKTQTIRSTLKKCPHSNPPVSDTDENVLCHKGLRS